ncbi:hypothetical protein [Kineosporia sp. NBRC 101731]|uniref:hypothetical protein n=1 Tax=Kineosporia sp. NBRC 101731 TaxID=3032199 RepID=UPI0024A39748|nr:hypothetical protein [Kineosporia sp. NBRC 101731]GLY33369.1 hypothetical protein Kisp02_67340 [Kineosporia sp. NBRC 101731]
MSDLVVDLTVVEIDSTVRAVLARQLQVPADALAGTGPLTRVLDETAHPALLTAMGEALDATFPDDFLEGVHTVNDLTSAVRVSLRA